MGFYFMLFKQLYGFQQHYFQKSCCVTQQQVVRIRIEHQANFMTISILGQRISSTVPFFFSFTLFANW
jgi:hypothetical protein